MIAAMWLLVIIGYDHTVTTATYQTEASCEAATVPANTRYHVCVSLS
jgi:hypothetical protein